MLFVLYIIFPRLQFSQKHFSYPNHRDTWTNTMPTFFLFIHESWQKNWYNNTAPNHPPRNAERFHRIDWMLIQGCHSPDRWILFSFETSQWSLWIALYRTESKGQISGKKTIPDERWSWPEEDCPVPSLALLQRFHPPGENVVLKQSFLYRFQRPLWHGSSPWKWCLRPIKIPFMLLAKLWNIQPDGELSRLPSQWECEVLTQFLQLSFGKICANHHVSFRFGKNR